MSKTVTLPSEVKDEKQLKELLTILSTVQDSDIVDFSDYRFYTPVAIVATLAVLKSKNALITPGIKKQSRYLQRIDFFRILRPSLDYQEPFKRNKAETFSPIQVISKVSNETKIAKSICFDVLSAVEKKKGALDSERKDNIKHTLSYAIGEIVRNVIQHSGADGFVCSQYFPGKDVVCIGIADCGIGILESFKQNNSEFFNFESDNDETMLRKALQDRTSSKFNVVSPYGVPDNQGVGLTRVDAICELLFGRFFIASGHANYFRDATFCNFSPMSNPFSGTIVGIEIHPFQLDNYPFRELISEAEGVGKETESNDFEELFI